MDLVEEVSPRILPTPGWSGAVPGCGNPPAVQPDGPLLRTQNFSGKRRRHFHQEVLKQSLRRCRYSTLVNLSEQVVHYMPYLRRL
jgi:hypothetical protein